MRRVVVFVMLALALLVVEPLPVQAHGTCSSNAGVTFSGSNVVFSGSLACSMNHPGGYSLSVDLRRRLPGGSWQIPPSGPYHIHKTCTQGGTTCATSAAIAPRNCSYDYKAFTTASAIGAHSIPSNTQIKSHTC